MFRSSVFKIRKREHKTPYSVNAASTIIYKKYLGFTLLAVRRETEEKEKAGNTELHLHKGWSPCKKIETEAAR